MDVHETIKNAPLFANLSKKDIKHLVAALTERTIPAGTVIIEQGKPGVGFFVIGGGSATVAVRGKAIQSLGAGDHFGEVALIDDGPRMAEVKADTDMECCVLPAWQFRAFVHDHPDVAWALMQSLVKRIVRDSEAGEEP
ncbi:MAG TPA: cyclic nucleotide-binding domain-containing protein [Acidimicrobiales bacterium]|nr:cyclic nucleotide-binding domain-containing protein [Acidimicrobiales bacterium]